MFKKKNPTEYIISAKEQEFVYENINLNKAYTLLNTAYKTFI